jgi:hypothetical protein
MEILLVENVNRDVVLNGHNHRLEDVHIPTVRDPQAETLACFRHQTAAQGHAKISRGDAENDRLPHPGCVSTFHRWSPETSLPRTASLSGRGSNWPMVQADKKGGSSVLSRREERQNQKGFSAIVNARLTGTAPFHIVLLRTPSKPCDIC